MSASFGFSLASAAKSLSAPAESPVSILALPRISAANRVPVPIGLVRIKASPGFRPCLRQAAKVAARGPPNW